MKIKLLRSNEDAMKNKACCTNDNMPYLIMNTYTPALYNAGEFTIAKTWAEKVIAKGKTENENTAETEKLLRFILKAIKEG